jgi:hypothetical protein
MIIIIVKIIHYKISKYTRLARLFASNGELRMKLFLEDRMVIYVIRTKRKIFRTISWTLLDETMIPKYCFRHLSYIIF